VHQTRNTSSTRDVIGAFSLSEVHISRIAHYIEQIASRDSTVKENSNAQKQVARIVNVYSSHSGSHDDDKNRTICKFISLI
jgi:hypothetical protein